MTAKLSARLFAEFIGVFALVFIGSAAIALTGTGDADLLAVALAHGLVIAVMVCAVGHVSGGHFNPAVTFGMMITRHIPALEGVWYWLAQIAGGIAGAWVLLWVTPGGWLDLDGGGNATVPAVSGEIGLGAAVGLEAVLTFFLVWVIYGVAVDKRGSFAIVAGLPIGLVITFDILAGGPLTGAAMNPARAFGPALAFAEFGDWWVYWVGPLIGGAAGAVAYSTVIGAGDAPKDVAVD